LWLKLFLLGNFKNCLLFSQLTKNCRFIQVFGLLTYVSFRYYSFAKYALREKNAVIYIYHVCYRCQQHIFDFPAAIIRNLLTRIPGWWYVSRDSIHHLYKSRFEDVFGFMGLLIFARGKESVFSVIRWRYFDHGFCRVTRQGNMIAPVMERPFSDLRKCETKVINICRIQRSESKTRLMLDIKKVDF